MEQVYKDGTCTYPTALFPMVYLYLINIYVTPIMYTQ